MRFVRQDCCEILLTKGKVALVDWVDQHLVGHLWKLCENGGKLYAGRQIKKRQVYLHRVIMGAGPHQLVDHRNGDGLDCRRRNLRVTDHTGNMRNFQGARKDSSTGVLGVYPRGERFCAGIGVNHRPVHLGTYDTIEEAALARKAGELKYWNDDDA